MIKKTYNKIVALISGMTDKAVQELLQNMQKYLGMDVGRATIKRILQDHGIVPDPELKRRISENLLAAFSMPG